MRHGSLHVEPYKVHAKAEICANTRRRTFTEKAYLNSIEVGLVGVSLFH